MFDIYVENNSTGEKTPPPLVLTEPSGAGTASGLASTAIKTKLTVTGHIDAGEVSLLAPRFHFTSFTSLKAQIEDVVLSIPNSRAVSLLSLQHRDADGDWIDLLASTFDPEDFRRLPRVFLRAKVATTRKRPSPPLPKFTRKNQTTQRAAATGGAGPRRALGRRDVNTLPTVPSSARMLDGSSKKALKLKTTRASSSAEGVGVTAAASQQCSASISQTPASQILSRVPSSATTSRSRFMRRTPEFVFSAGSRAPNPSTSISEVVAPSSRRRQRVAASARKPGWNNGNELAWEEVCRVFKSYNINNTSV